VSTLRRGDACCVSGEFLVLGGVFNWVWVV
jgi:hypothetical protein